MRVMLISAFCLYSLPAQAATPLLEKPGDRVDAHDFRVSNFGAQVERLYPDQGTGIAPTSTGARLVAQFQKLEGQVSAHGLTLYSMEPSATGDQEAFGIKAVALGRQGSLTYQLPPSGQVFITERMVSYIREGVAEEYRTGVDGIRQDFVISEHMRGEGPLAVQLSINGADAEARTYGAQLVLKESGRAIAYSRLQVVDASGEVLEAKIKVLTPNRMLIVVEDQDAVYPIRIDPTYSDADWISTGGFPGADNDVNALAADGVGNLYVAGDFVAVGDVVANHIAKWDGNQWSALGSGVNGSVYALELSGSNLYVGGTFSIAGGIQASNLATWNGAKWTSIGGGVDGNVNALLFDGFNLYAGGAFSNAGGNPANCIAMWNGSIWSAMGDGFIAVSGDDPYVSALQIFDGQLYVGGRIHKSGATDTVSIAKWNGSAWEALNNGLGTSNSDNGVWDLTVFGDELVAVGYFSTASGVSVANIAKWNGSAWTGLGSGLNNYGYALAASADTLYAGGLFSAAGGSSASHIAAWNGSTWSTVGDGLDDYVYALEMVDATLFAGGDFGEAGNVTANNIAKWESGTWSSLGGGFDEPIEAMAVSGTDLYVGGFFASVPGTAANHVAKWSGSTWSPLGSGVDGDFFSLVSALVVMDNELYVGGAFTSAGGVAANNIAKWDGANWSALGSGVSGDFFSRVNALAVMDGELYVGGTFTNAGGVAANSIAKWDGDTWSALGAGLTSDAVGPESEPAEVDVIVVSGADLFAGGLFSKAGGMPANNIARWDGSAWFPLGTGTASGPEEGFAPVLALAGSADGLYAGGLFAEAGGVAANNIAKWNGSTWSALGATDSLSNEVEALAIVGSELYVGGRFANVAGTGANGIAVWDGAAWSPVGGMLVDSSGNPGSVSSLILFGNDLYVGGDFTLAGGLVSPFLTFARPGSGSGYSGPFIVYGEGQATVYLLVDSVGQYEIKRSTNLVLNVWETLGTVPGGTNGVVSYTDTAPPLPTAYYRALFVGP